MLSKHIHIAISLERMQPPYNYYYSHRSFHVHDNSKSAQSCSMLDNF